MRLKAVADFVLLSVGGLCGVAPALKRLFHGVKTALMPQTAVCGIGIADRTKRYNGRNWVVGNVLERRGDGEKTSDLIRIAGSGTEKTT